jgi:hypothetical protein
MTRLEKLESRLDRAEHQMGEACAAWLAARNTPAETKLRRAYDRKWRACCQLQDEHYTATAN